MSTALMIASDKGGPGKSATAMHIIAALRLCGYTVMAIDGDHINQTLSRKDKLAHKADIRTTPELDSLFKRLSNFPEDIAVVDMPASSGDIMRKYLEGLSLAFITQELGLRLVVGLVIVEDDAVLNGLLPWIEPFIGKCMFMLFANARETPDGAVFKVENLEKGSALLKIAGHRVVHIPRLTPEQKEHIRAHQLLPSGFIEKSGPLDPLERQRWKIHLYEVIQSLEPHLSFLTGKSAPAMPENYTSYAPKTPAPSPAPSLDDLDRIAATMTPTKTKK